MTISIQLSSRLQAQLIAYCHIHQLSENQAIEQALLRLLDESRKPTAYELGADGFGADQTTTGDIARNSKGLLREHFRGSSAC
ncbi:hypothetical protein [Thiorhodovibrio winogradskyi]|uniref:hypothetical protein n=1 Tax=Thiorhodovibrio winogradskyi TaxID=77007 RepID=UPI002E2D0CE8|nr:hypothetical protein [Thiorhodovibrio winogradskyi]